MALVMALVMTLVMAVVMALVTNRYKQKKQDKYFLREQLMTSI